MKCFYIFVQILFSIYLLFGTVICSHADDESGMYEWTDDSGTVNFSDNPVSIPKKFENKVKRKESIKGSSAPDQVKGEKQIVIRKVTSDIEIHGGHDEGWWRNRFSTMRTQILQIKESMPEKRNRLKELNYSKNVSIFMRFKGTHRQNKLAYEELYNEIKKDEENLAKLEEEEVKLKEMASRAGVPHDWMQ